MVHDIHINVMLAHATSLLQVPVVYILISRSAEKTFVGCTSVEVGKLLGALDCGPIDTLYLAVRNLQC